MRRLRLTIILPALLVAALLCVPALGQTDASGGRFAMIVVPPDGLASTSAQPHEVRMMGYLLEDPMAGNFHLFRDKADITADPAWQAAADDEGVVLFYVFGPAGAVDADLDWQEPTGEPDAAPLKLVITDTTSAASSPTAGGPSLSVAVAPEEMRLEISFTGEVAADKSPARLFTRVLRGAADVDRDRQVTVAELIDYLVEKSTLESSDDLGDVAGRVLFRQKTIDEFIDLYGTDGALDQAGRYVSQERWVDAYLMLNRISDTSGSDPEFRRLGRLARFNLYIESRYAGDRRNENVNRSTSEGLDYVAKMLTLANVNYVEPVDNRELFAGGLENLELLLSNSNVKRELTIELDDDVILDFVAFLAETKEHVRSRETLSERGFRDSVQRILRENDSTVKLPHGVVVTEFIYGIPAALDDNSDFISAAGYREFQDDTAGHFGGLGIEITMEEVTLEQRALTVITPLNNTPAAEAGLLPGDRILAIDGESTEGMDLTDAVGRLRGPVGTTVTLTVSHRDDTDEFDVTIERGIIHLESVKGYDVDPDTGVWRFLIDGEAGIGYIRLTDFKEDTPQHLDKAISALEKSGMKGLILDLRFNHGGLLTSGVQIADRFLSEGTIVTVRSGQDRVVPFNAHYFRTYNRFPMTVLINDETASAAEIVAGALKDSERAVLVGSRTFGKGTVQTVYELERGKAAFKLTTAKYYTPSGISIHREPFSPDGGLEPDVEVLMSAEDKSRLREVWHLRGLQHDARERLIERARTREGEASRRTVTAPELFEDEQLDRATELLRATIKEESESTEVAVH